jgi:hypothetical protein
MTQYITIVQNEDHQYFIPMFIHCVYIIKSKENSTKKMKKNCQPNPLTCESHIFTNWTLFAFRHTYCTFFIKTITVKKGPIQEFNLFQFVSNWSLRFWILNHHLKQL